MLQPLLTARGFAIAITAQHNFDNILNNARVADIAKFGLRECSYAPCYAKELTVKARSGWIKSIWFRLSRFSAGIQGLFGLSWRMVLLA